jgi:hypothetical protein
VQKMTGVAADQILTVRENVASGTH